MNMKTWAENEVERRIQFEREGASPDEPFLDYTTACLESALEAFNCLLEQDHSGMSIRLTKAFLDRLIDDKPLTAISDTDDVWNPGYTRNDTIIYQCSRMSSFFKTVYPDGHVEYHDNDRVVCYNVDNPMVSFTNNFVSRVVSEIFPIKMPYWPENRPYEVYVKEWLEDPKRGDYDHIEILYIVTPKGDKVDVNRTFKETDDGWEEITDESYHD